MSRPPSSTIFVGNLPFDVTEQALADIFSSAGPVKSMRLVMDKDTGRPKGFGFCEFYDQETAQSAMRNLNGHDVNGRSIRIDFAEDFQTRAPRGDGRPPPAPVASGPGTKPIGRAAADMSAVSVAQLLGAPPSNDRETQEQLNKAFAGMSKAQLYDVMREIKNLISGDRAGARQYFAERPWLTKVLFQGQILLGMVKAPPPPEAGAPPMAPAPGALPYQQPADVYGAPVYQQQSQPMGAFQEGPMGLAGRGMAPPQPAGPPPPPPRAGAGPPAPMGMPGAPPPPPPRPLGDHMMQPPPLMQQQLAPPGMQPQQAMGGPLGPDMGMGMMQPQQQMQQPMQPPQQQMQLPQQMQPQQVMQPQQQPMQQAPAKGGLGLGNPEETMALLRQVLSLTDEQIAALAPEHRQQVLYVKEQVALGNLKL